MGSELNILRIIVDKKSSARQVLPERLSTITRYNLQDAVNYENPRVFKMTLQQQPPYWTFNGRTFEMEDVAADELVKLNTMEVWEFINQPAISGTEVMHTAHPIHLHGSHFQVIERQISPEMALDYALVSEGYVDDGWKDTVLVMPGERVRFLRRFENYAGLYLYHCHNLEHEDMGMMRNFRITA